MTGPKRALDTPSRPQATTCDALKGDAEVPDLLDAPNMAISPRGDLYAYADWRVLSIYRASDDSKVASIPYPPYSEDDRRTEDPARLVFSSSGRYVVLRLDDGKRQVWYEIAL